jgi:mono/diheme cytochrome c family protein
MPRAAEARSGWLLVVLGIGFAGGDVAAQTLGDVSAGRQLALENCSSCHVVVDRQTRPAMDGVPPFREIAADPRSTALRLRGILQTPHPTMPSFILSRDDQDNLIAYIQSLTVR